MNNPVDAYFERKRLNLFAMRETNPREIPAKKIKKQIKESPNTPIIFHSRISLSRTTIERFPLVSRYPVSWNVVHTKLRRSPAPLTVYLRQWKRMQPFSTVSKAKVTYTHIDTYIYTREQIHRTETLAWKEAREEADTRLIVATLASLLYRSFAKVRQFAFSRTRQRRRSKDAAFG